MTSPFTRREFIATGLAATASFARGNPPAPEHVNVHEQILEIALEHQKKRRERFAAVKTMEDLVVLQKELRQKWINLLDGLPEAKGPPPVKKLGQIDGGDYTVDKIAYESFPGYFVSALLYMPKKRDGAVPGILGPCGHTGNGKGGYQGIHINLAKRGYVTLCYDPVGQGERSQFWDAKATPPRSKYNLACGEHAVLGNPMYLLGTSLARYRIWDGMRGIDLLCSMPEVDPKRIGCIGQSGGGTLSAYISCLDERVTVGIPTGYITSLPKRMANRIQEDPESDPEQDIWGIVSEGIDHAGMLVLRVPKPTMLGTAVRDFFPIMGSRETYDELARIYELVAKVPERFMKVEANARHGQSISIREGAYVWFDRWLMQYKGDPRMIEIPVKGRSNAEIQVCAEGQVNVTFKSKPLPILCVEEFKKQPKTKQVPLKDLLVMDPDKADFILTKTDATGNRDQPHVICVNGNESAEWQKEAAFVGALGKAGLGLTVVDPRGVWKMRPTGLQENSPQLRNSTWVNALSSVEGNIAYNAFLVGKNLIGMRVADVLKAVAKVKADTKATKIVLCGRKDGAFIALFAAAMDPTIHAIALEEMPLSYWPFFDPAGRTINAASLLPKMLRDYGDINKVVAEIAPRRLLAAAPTPQGDYEAKNLTLTDKKFSADASLLLDWLKK